ncbi:MULTISPECIES: hypothetical protein [unclassified Calothrix]|nr:MULTISPECIES: hypothetical protein [unclassified Calothrix]
MTNESKATITSLGNLLVAIAFFAPLPRQGEFPSIYRVSEKYR